MVIRKYWQENLSQARETTQEVQALAVYRPSVACSIPGAHVKDEGENKPHTVVLRPHAQA